MNLRTTILGSRAPEADAPEALAERRIASARTCRSWTEIDGERLARRVRGFLVDPETDEVFERYRGDAFAPSGAVLADMSDLVFYVDDDVHVLSRYPRTWQEIVGRR